MYRMLVAGVGKPFITGDASCLKLLKLYLLQQSRLFSEIYKWIEVKMKDYFPLNPIHPRT